MQVPVADVAVRHHSDARDSLLERPVGAFHEGRDATDGDGDVVLEAGALVVLCLRDAFPQRPQGGRLRRRGGDDRVHHQAALDRLSQRRFDHFVESRDGQRVAQLHERVPGMAIANGSRAPDKWRSTKSTLRRDMISKPVSRSPASSRRMPIRSTAACGPGRATHAVTRLRTAGKSLSTAAVMTPSVPSAPMTAA